MKLEKYPAEQLETWRNDPVTQAYFAELNEAAARAQRALEGATDTGSEAQMRRIGGILQGLRTAASIASTKGGEDE